MTRVYSIEEAAEKVRDLINNVEGTYYFVMELEDLEDEYNTREIQVRVSDHSANAQNNTRDFDGMISFISDWNKQSSNMMTEYILDNDGDFTETFRNVEECLTWEFE